MRRIALYLDEGRLARLRGTPFEGFVRPTFGGGCLCWSWTTPWGVGASAFSLGWGGCSGLCGGSSGVF